MEALTTQSSMVYQVTLVVILIAALVRLADGLREFPFERITLVLVTIGAFFLLASNVDHAEFRSGSDLARGTIVVASYAITYFRFKASDPCI